MKQAPTLLINPACSPLGQALAIQASEHYRVALLCQDKVRGNRLCEQLHAAGKEALILERRHAQPRDFQHAVDRILRRWQRLDAVINLPATLTVGPFEATTQPHWDALYQEQLMTIVSLSQSAIGAMREQQAGIFLNVTTEHGLLPSPLASAQSAISAAVVSLSDSLNAEWHPLGIKVKTVVLPGYSAQAELLQASDPLSLARFRRLLESSEYTVAELAKHLMDALSDRAGSLVIPAAQTRHAWRKKRWFRRHWEAGLRALGERFR